MGTEMTARKQFLVLVLVIGLSGPAAAQDAGLVSFATGDVSAERQPAVTLAKGDAVRASDAVITGSASRAQLLMNDGARIAIRPDSRIVLDEYVYAAAATGGAAVSSSSDSSVISLVKGGFRTITGAIGKENPANYEVRTAVGVLGIRGTNFALLLCGSCNSAPGVPAGTSVPQGLYIMVNEGSIVFRNEVGSIDVAAGEFAFIPFASREPTRLEATPPVFIDDSDFRFETDTASLSGFDRKLGLRREADASAPPPQSTAPGSSTQDDGSNNAVPAQSIIGTDADGRSIDLTPGGAPDPGNRSITWSIGPVGARVFVFSGSHDNAPGRYQIDANGNLVRFDNVFPAATGPDIASFDLGNSTAVENGFDALTVMRWGRWSGGTAGITLSDGSDASLALDNQSLHWVASPEWATPAAMPITGVANYTLVGATSPTDNLGNVGVLGSASLRADFTNMQVDSTLLIDINGASWSATGNGNIGAAAQLPAHMFQGFYGNVAIDGIAGGNGIFSGFFSEPGPTSDPAFPGGAGLTYSLQDMSGTTSISGAAVFGNP